jgi:hypothetical protein
MISEKWLQLTYYYTDNYSRKAQEEISLNDKVLKIQEENGYDGKSGMKNYDVYFIQWS